MSFEIRPLGEGFGAEVIGLDLARSLSDDDFETVRDDRVSSLSALGGGEGRGEVGESRV